MANTLKLGAGKWATGKDTVLSFNDENGNFKPLPFSFSRASSATVVNQSGLIETVGSGEPRIDFLDNTKGALKLEPQRTNVLDNSSNFFLGSWSGTRVINGSTINAPDGNNEAHKLIATSVSNTHYREYTVSSASSGSYTGSCFFKKGEFNVGAIRMSVDSYANRIGVYINLDNGTHLRTSTVGSPTGTSYKIEDYGNGWYRLSVSIIHTSGEVRMSLSNASSDYSNSNGLPVFLGNNSDGGYSWGAQLEQGSYATSYIPTSGQSGGVTRVADTCEQTVPDGVIGQTEGTVFLDFNVDSIQDNGRIFAIGDGGTNNRVLVRFETNGYLAFASTGGVFQWSHTEATLSLGRHKMAIAYALNDVAFYVDGILVNSESTYSVPVTDKFYIGTSEYGGAENTNMKINNSKLYNTRLSNSELAALTTI